MREGKKGHGVEEWSKEREEVLFCLYVDASGIYRAVCGQEIQRDAGTGTVESLQARCSAEIFRLLKWREMRGCCHASVFAECCWEMFTTA